MVQRIDELSIRIETRASTIVAEAKLRITAAEAKLGSIRPDKVFEILRGKIESLHGRLFLKGVSSTERLSTSITQLRERLRRAVPIEKINQYRAIVDVLGGRLLIGASRGVDDARNIVTGLGLRLESINPQRVLERGYSIVRVKGKNVRSIAEVSEGDGMEISVSDGLVVGTVTSCSKER
jgi:exodeoxyribonuclease VII large subunit